MEVSQNLNHGLSSFTVYRGTRFNKKNGDKNKIANQIAVVSAKEILTRKNKFTDTDHTDHAHDYVYNTQQLSNTITPYRIESKIITPRQLPINLLLQIPLEFLLPHFIFNHQRLILSHV